MSSFLQPLQPAETETDPHRPRGPARHLRARGRLAGRYRWISLAQAVAAIWSVSPLPPETTRPKILLPTLRRQLDKKPQNFLLSVVHLESLSINHHHQPPLVTVAACASGTTPLSSFLLVSFLSSPQPSTSSIAMASAAPSTGSTKVDAVVQKAAASAPGQLSGLQLYSRFAFAGAVCCSITHGALTPVDVYVASP